MVPNSLSNASANCCTPSVVNSSVIAFSEMPLLFEFGEDRAGALDVLLDGVGKNLTVIAEGIHGRRRNGIDGVTADQRLYI